jgi:hypothetical protein
MGIVRSRELSFSPSVSLTAMGSTEREDAPHEEREERRVDFEMMSSFIAYRTDKNSRLHNQVGDDRRCSYYSNDRNCPVVRFQLITHPLLDI